MTPEINKSISLAIKEEHRKRKAVLRDIIAAADSRKLFWFCIEYAREKHFQKTVIDLMMYGHSKEIFNPDKTFGNALRWWRRLDKFIDKKTPKA